MLVYEGAFTLLLSFVFARETFVKGTREYDAYKHVTNKIPCFVVLQRCGQVSQADDIPHEMIN